MIDKIWKFIEVTWDDKKVKTHEYRELKFEGVETSALPARYVIVFLFVL